MPLDGIQNVRPTIASDDILPSDEGAIVYRDRTFRQRAAQQRARMHLRDNRNAVLHLWELAHAVPPPPEGRRGDVAARHVVDAPVRRLQKVVLPPRSWTPVQRVIYRPIPEEVTPAPPRRNFQLEPLCWQQRRKRTP